MQENRLIFYIVKPVYVMHNIMWFIHSNDKILFFPTFIFYGRARNSSVL